MTATTTQPEATEKNHQGGAPKENTNAMTHGLSARHGLRGSGLPKGCGHIRRAINVFRRAIEAAVFDDRGEISLTDAAHINTAFRWERHAQLAQRWLMFQAETLSDADRLAYSRDVAKASTERDKSIAALRLPKRLQDNPCGLYDVPAAMLTQTSSNGDESPTESHNGTETT